MPLPLSTLDKRFLVALGISIAFHLSLLLWKFSQPPQPLSAEAPRASSPLQVRLAPSTPNTPEPMPPAPLILPRPQPTRPQRAIAKPRPRSQTAQLTRPPVEQEKTWTQAEKNEMNQFLNELNSEAQPPAAPELVRRSLAMARDFGKAEQKNDEMSKIERRLREAQVEPLGLELYFEALFRKLNSSAAMLRNNVRERGKQLAIVRIRLRPDGTVRDFVIVQSADQQNEIAYVKSVVDRAAPFPAFPSDIRKATDVLILQICIQPPRLSDSDGPQFTRMGPGQSCRPE